MTESNGHTEAALANAKDDYHEHMEGMSEAADTMKARPLVVNAYAMDDPSAPPLDQPNVKHAHFVRHGQGFHNLMADLAKEAGRKWENCVNAPENPYVMPEITDAPLTAKGRAQAAQIQEIVEAMDATAKPQLIALSPNCRALQTGTIAFSELVGKIPFLAHEMVREETGVHVCDRRRPTSQQAAEFPMVDFSLLTDEEDTIFNDSKRETKAELTERIYKFLEWLEGREESVVGVSSHSAWLLAVFNANLQAKDSLKGWFQTGEMRSVVLEFVRSSKKQKTDHP
jgi:broad specificity phosphatase PhoE